MTTGHIQDIGSCGDPTLALGDTQLRLMGWNVNSLSDYKTQVKFINKLKSAPENCVILCDTRLGSDSERVFRKLWGEQSYFNSFSTTQRGLAILIKDSLPVKDVQIENVIRT